MCDLWHRNRGKDGAVLPWERVFQSLSSTTEKVLVVSDGRSTCRSCLVVGQDHAGKNGPSDILVPGLLEH